MKALLAVLVGMALSLGIASATVPDPTLCSVTPLDETGAVVVSPECINGVEDPPDAIVFTVNVRNANDDPIPDAFVECIFGNPGNHYICGSAVLTGTTNEDGDVTFAIAAGGCTVEDGAFRIKANNVEIRAYDHVTSPDWDGTSGDGLVNALDLSAFGSSMGGGNSPCTDYDNNGATNALDLAVFGASWAYGCCTP